MSDTIKQALDTLYERVMEMPNKVLDIFNNFFGEERVDMQYFLSKETLINRVLEDTTVYSLFNIAEMKDKLPIMGVHQGVELIDIDFDSIPAESTAAIVEAFLSRPFAEYWKGEMNGFILVHFPRTVITNEYDKSTVANHIYIKVPITAYGTENGLFTMNRSEYTVAEIYSNYMHSHANFIPTDDFHKFTNCCLGTGPLRNTQTSLSANFDEDRWNIFCLELSKYVEVESIAGAPYHRLENISFKTSKVRNLDRLLNYNSLYFGGGLNSTILKDAAISFMNYYLDNNNLTFSFRNGVYSIGMSFIDYLINISNSFIEWVNKQPHLERVKGSFGKLIEDYSIRGGEVYQRSESVDRYIQSYRSYIGQEICTFKGRSVTISITDIDRIESINSSNVKLLNLNLASNLLNRILTTLNYRYGRNQEDPNTTPGKVGYKI